MNFLIRKSVYVGRLRKKLRTSFQIEVRDVTILSSYRDDQGAHDDVLGVRTLPTIISNFRPPCPILIGNKVGSR